MIDMKRLITKCNAKGRPHLVQINGQWLCIGDHYIGAGDTKPEAFEKRAAIAQAALMNADQRRSLLTQQQAQQTQQSHSVDTRKLNPWTDPQRGRQA